MITAIDTPVLLDVFSADEHFGLRSSNAVRSCVRDGALIACDMVWAEVAAAFPNEPDALEALERLGVRFHPLDRAAAALAAAGWRTYRSKGGGRDRVFADFLIAGHARLHADRLLTRDRGFFRTYFTELTVLDPSLD